MPFSMNCASLERFYNFSLLCRPPGLMSLLRHQGAGLKSNRRRTGRRTKVDRKVLARMPAIQKCSSQRVAPHTMMKTGLFVLHFRTTSASSRARQVRGVHVAITSATSKDVTGTSHFTCATTLTEATRNQFYRCRARANPFLLKFSLDEVHCPKPPCKQAFQF